jgi:hypothetical protein
MRLRHGPRVDRRGRAGSRGNGRSRGRRVLPSVCRARVRVLASLGDAVHLRVSGLTATGGCLPQEIPHLSSTATAYSWRCGGRGVPTTDRGTTEPVLLFGPWPPRHFLRRSPTTDWPHQALAMLARIISHFYASRAHATSVSQGRSSPRRLSRSAGPERLRKGGGRPIRHKRNRLTR